MSGKNELFEISNLNHNDGKIVAVLKINKDCDIFKGHFPGQPVVPGACMLQIVKDVLQDALNAPIRLKKADHFKFIRMVDPENTPSVNLDITYKLADDDINVNAKLSAGQEVCFKFQGSFVKG